ncbi:GD12537 [Drosophila simulans]|uniref:GD12537 n=1 Tax=Drosophila simulans TaxID=7240 RepID=B4QL69_DROSI|nr:GD12537 [Drosophila simulans]
MAMKMELELEMELGLYLLGDVVRPLVNTSNTADIPIIPSRNVNIATYADDTAFLASSSDPREASETIQRQIDALHPWLSRWNIVVNAEKSTQTTFALRRGDCPPVTLNGVIIPNAPAPKYLGLTLDRRLTWRPHIVSKRIQADARLRQMHWLIGRGSKLRQNHKILVYKAILKPIWTYGIQLWGTASHTNRLRIQRFQNRCLRIASPVANNQRRPKVSVASPAVATGQQKAVPILPTAIVVLDTGSKTFETGAMIDPCMPVSSIDRSLAAAFRLPIARLGGNEVCSTQPLPTFYQNTEHPPSLPSTTSCEKCLGTRIMPGKKHVFNA